MNENGDSTNFASQREAWYYIFVLVFVFALTLFVTTSSLRSLPSFHGKIRVTTSIMLHNIIKLINGCLNGFSGA